MSIRLCSVRFYEVRGSFFDLRAICLCGWTGGGRGDRAYWAARQHFEEMRAG